MMVTFKVDADARVQGSNDQEKNPIVAKVKGTGKDGALGVQVFSPDSSPLAAKISGDAESPIAIAPISVGPITVIPDLKNAAEVIDIEALVGALAKISQGLKVEVANSAAPLSIALGKIPVDLTVSVSSPAQETVFRVEIKGVIGEQSS
ncbi:MAG: hypothetical protein LUQ44_07960 [Methanothrix sp.]|nr:hypothetical protein [Methanothrix sp.]